MSLDGVTGFYLVFFRSRVWYGLLFPGAGSIPRSPRLSEAIFYLVFFPRMIFLLNLIVLGSSDELIALISFD